MSLWDVVAGVSYGRNIRHPGEDGSNILKKINSASLSVLNGEKVDYVGAGGRTTNTFGAVTMINCDMGAVIQGHFSPKTQQWTGAWFGPGVVNLMNIGNKTKLQYMPEKSSNYNFRRGGAEINMIYEYKKGTDVPKTAITVLIFLFALSIFGFYLIYNFFGACGKDKMSPVGDSEYIKDQQGKLQTTDKEIAELEASEAQQKELQQQHAAEGYVPSPAEQKAQDEELEYTEKQLADAEAQRDNLEISLKKAERQKDWLIFGNVILENRGFWVIKTVEQFKGASARLLTSVEEKRQAVDEDGKKISTDGANELLCAKTDTVLESQPILNNAIANNIANNFRKIDLGQQMKRSDSTDSFGNRRLI